jgi:choline transport protein
MIQLQHPEYVNGGWHTAFIIIATLAFGVFINICVFELLPWFEVIAGILNLCLFFIFLVVLLVMLPHNNSSILLMPNMSSGWENYFVSRNIGSLSSIFLFIGKLLRLFVTKAHF